MKRCEREWKPARAAGVQRMVRELCGFCPCEEGIPCPLFKPVVRAEVETDLPPKVA